MDSEITICEYHRRHQVPAWGVGCRGRWSGKWEEKKVGKGRSREEKCYYLGGGRGEQQKTQQ